LYSFGDTFLLLIIPFAKFVLFLSLFSF
jgi:hypothetical protein